MVARREPEPPAPLQFGTSRSTNSSIAPRIDRREHEAVSADEVEMGLELVGNVGRRAYHLWQADRLAMDLRHLLQRQKLAGHRAIARLNAPQLGLGAMGHHRVARQGRQVEVEVAGQDGEAALQWHQRVMLGLHVGCFGARGADESAAP